MFYLVKKKKEINDKISICKNVIYTMKIIPFQGGHFEAPQIAQWLYVDKCLATAPLEKEPNSLKCRLGTGGSLVTQIL